MEYPYKVSWTSIDPRWFGETVEQFFTDYLMARDLAFDIYNRGRKDVKLWELKGDNWFELPEERILRRITV